MLSGTDCGLLLLLLLLGGLAVAPAMNAFPRLALLALGAVPLLVTCLPQTKHSLFSYRRFRSAFNRAVLALWLPSCLSAALPCSLVPAAATDLASRRVAVCRRAASLASITAWSRRCWSMMLNKYVGVMHNEIERHLSFNLAAKLKWLYSRRYRLDQHLAMIQRVMPTIGLHHVR